MSEYKPNKLVDLMAVVTGVAIFGGIPLAIGLLVLGIPNPLTDLFLTLVDIVFAMAQSDACSVGSQRPWLCEQ